MTSSRSVSSRASASLTSPLATILLADSLAVDAAAVVADGDDHAVAAVRGLRARPCPARGLPAASRSSGGSRPWSTELRTMWISGSAQLVDHPLVELGLLALDLERDFLARERLRSRMTRRNRSNSGPIGTIRVSSTPF